MPGHHCGAGGHDPLRGLTDAQRRAVEALASVDRDFVGLLASRLPGGEPVACELEAAGWCVRWAMPGVPAYLFLTPWAMERLGLDIEEHGVWATVRDERGRKVGVWEDRPKLCHAEPRGLGRRRPIRLKAEARTSALRFPELIPTRDRDWYADSDGSADGVPFVPEPVCNEWGTPIRVAGLDLYRAVDLARLRRIEARARREKKKASKRRKVRVRNPPDGARGAPGTR